MDQHDPEEVAKYFEKHKHELPRSHEVCITRFQSNTESIEQLDRKYGNLVNMIQGLGQKHQAWLPEEPEDAIEEEPEGEPDVATDVKADAKVQKWAKAVSASLQDGTPPLQEEEQEEQGIDDTRLSQFDRPLKEVRVGESPSRPWGISIPAKYTNAESSSSVGSAPTASPQLPLQSGQPVGDTPQRTGKCPFDHRAMMGKMPAQPDLVSATQPLPQSEHGEVPPPPPKHQSHAQTQTQKTNDYGAPSPNVVPQMVFNGPVFLGYPPDQLATLLQNSNLGASLR